MARLSVKVSPKASRNAIAGWMGEQLKVSVTAAPEHGKANAAVEALLAEALHLPRGAVEVVAGHGAKSKQLVLSGISQAQLRARLDALLHSRR